MLRTLLPRCAARVVHRAPEQPRALAGGAASHARQLGFEDASLRAAPGARARGRRGVGARATAAAVLVTGSVYLVGELLGALGAGLEPSSRRALRSAGDERRGPSVLTMIGAVALIVALVILVFFAAGYGFGRLFL